LKQDGTGPLTSAPRGDSIKSKSVIEHAD